MHGTRVSQNTTHTEINRNHRQRSTSQTIVAEGGDRRQTYGGLRRTSSNTNMRTPQRVTRSPGNRTPSTVTALMSNSEQNRRMATENTTKVMDIIQTNRSFFSRLNLGSGGLKTMNLNQFIDIISFFMIHIGGKYTITKIRSNHEAVILNFLQTIHFPYAINKSCLKAPNAHQSYPEIVAILGFLCDLVQDINQYAVPTEMPLKHCDRLNNDEYTQLFSAETLRNYKEYTHEVLLDEECMAKLVNGMIASKMKINGLTANELAARTEKLEKSTKELRKQLTESDSDKYFRTIERQFADKETEYEKLKEILTEKRRFLKMMTLTHEEKARKLAAKQAELNELMYQIQHQKYTTIDVKQLIAKETLLKSSIAMIQGEKEAIKAETSDAQVKLARMHKIKLDLIKKFNDLTFQIVKTLMQSNQFKGLNVNDFTIDPDASAKAIQKICLRLNQLYEHCYTAKREYIEQMEQSKKMLIERRAEHGRLTEKHAEQMAIYQKANKKLDKLHQMCLKCEDKGSLSTAMLQREIAEKIATKKRIDDEIVSLWKKAEELEAQNVQLYQEGEQKAQEIMQAKQKLIKELDEVSDILDEYIQNI